MKFTFTLFFGFAIGTIIAINQSIEIILFTTILTGSLVSILYFLLLMVRKIIIKLLPQKKLKTETLNNLADSSLLGFDHQGALKIESLQVDD